MISSILQYLKTNKYLPSDYDENVNVYFGHSIIFHFFLPEKRSLAVKVANNGSTNANSLKAEAAALSENFALYGGIIPQLIRFDSDKDFSFLIMEGIAIARINLADIFSLSGNQANIMQRLLSGEDRINSHENKTPIINLMSAIETLPDELSCHYKRIMVERKWQEYIQDLPSISQHGDLGLTNIGKTPDGIIVFDWEDYGIINVPGFDLFTLLISGCHFKLDRLKNIINDIYQKNETQPHFLAPVVTQLNIDQQYFIDLIMINLILFHDLKCKLSYSDDVINDCRNLLEELNSHSFS